MNQKLINLIREEFEKILATKTGWGRNQIMEAYNQAVTNAVTKILDQRT